MYPKLTNLQQNFKNEGVEKLHHDDILPAHFCWAVVGNPGSGKTTFIQNLIEQPYKDKFDYIFVISPSNIKIQGVDQECVTNQLQLSWIYERLNYLQQQNKQQQNLLIIMDDCIGQIKKLQNDQMLIDLFFNRRHIWKNNTISIIITTQQFTMVPLRFRSVCNYFTFLSISPRDFDFIKKELIYSSSKKCLDQILAVFQENSHQFIYIRTQPFLLCQNFKPIIKGSQYVSLSNDFQSVQNAKPEITAKQKQLTEEPKQQQSQKNPQIQKQLFFFN